MTDRKYGKWELVRSLSEGGQAHTYLASDSSSELDGLFVLKRLKNLSRVQRFDTEIKAISQLSHRNVVRLVDYSLTASKPFLVMEHCEGGTLEKADLAGWTTLDRLRLFQEILEGVAHAHNNQIVHRDLKPANIFLKADGRTPVVGDFGICYFDGNGNRFTLTDEAVGARRYTAPELEDGRPSAVSSRSDVYSLGKILYWIFAGRVFDREKHREAEWDITGRYVDRYPWRLSDRAIVKELLDDSIRLDPNDRLSDAYQFKAWVDLAIWRISRGASTTDTRERLRCIFCGLGEYKKVIASGIPCSHEESVILAQHGLSSVDSSRWLVLRCPNCGNTQNFRIDKCDPDSWNGLG